MQLEDQVISLGLAIKLKELGVKQNSLFYWLETEIGFYISIKENVKLINYQNEVLCGSCCKKCEKIIKYKNIISAFTASELLELLPPEINNFSLLMNKDNPYYYVYYQEEFPDLYDAPKRLCIISDKIFANSCAKLLIYLIEQGLIILELNVNTFKNLFIKYLTFQH